MINVLLWAFLGDSIWVSGNDERRVRPVVCVHVLEGSVGCTGTISQLIWSISIIAYLSQDRKIWIEKLQNREEDRIGYGPNDPELPADILNSDGSDFHNGEIRDPEHAWSD